MALQNKDTMTLHKQNQKQNKEICHFLRQDCKEKL